MFSARPAKPSDASFLAAAMVDASRSGAARGLWDFVIPDEDARLQVLADIANSDTVSFCHHRWFLILESDARPVAAVAGFRPLDAPPRSLFEALRGSMGADALAAWKRFASVSGAFPPANPDDWVIEWLSVEAEARGTGAGRAALEAIMQAGRSAGCTWAQGNAFTSNPAVTALYMKLGFAQCGSHLDAQFEKATGSAGIDAYRVCLSA